MQLASEHTFSNLPCRTENPSLESLSVKWKPAPGLEQQDTSAGGCHHKNFQQFDFDKPLPSISSFFISMPQQGVMKEFSEGFHGKFILRWFFSRKRWRHWRVTSEPQLVRIRAAKRVHGTDHAAQCPSDSTRAFRSTLEAMHQNESKMWKDFVKTKFTYWLTVQFFSICQLQLMSRWKRPEASRFFSTKEGLFLLTLMRLAFICCYAKDTCIFAI